MEYFLLDLTAHDQAKLDMYSKINIKDLTNREFLEFGWLKARRVAYDKQIQNEK